MVYKIHTPLYAGLASVAASGYTSPPAIIAPHGNDIKFQSRNALSMQSSNPPTNCSMNIGKVPPRLAKQLEVLIVQADR